MISLEEYKAAGGVRGFDGSPLYYKGEEKPLYYRLFKWKKSKMFINMNVLEGHLRTELFDSVDKKIAYIQGVFENLGLKGDEVFFTNASKKVERCIKWINDIAYHQQGWLWGQGVISHNIKLNCIPTIHTLKIDLKVVDFIKNYKL